MLVYGALGWPASIPFTDGNVIGALLDRNGLRPSRYTLPKMVCNYGF
jgi:glutamate synthase domain-containing protein 1